jgi:hypothetical protein
MRRSTQALLIAVLIAVAGTACGDSSAVPLDPETPALAIRTDHSNIRVDFLLEDVDNPCTPAIESITLEGVIHGQGSQWDNDHFKSHYNVALTGEDANGVRYVGSSTGNGKGEFPGSETEDVVISTPLISQGDVPNFITKIVLHHHKDGTITVDKAGEECRG